MNLRAILTVGPRQLPADGWAEVWIDTGAGPGYVTLVPNHWLALSPADDGEGEGAIYRLQPCDEG